MKRNRINSDRKKKRNEQILGRSVLDWKSFPLSAALNLAVSQALRVEKRLHESKSYSLSLALLLAKAAG